MYREWVWKNFVVSVWLLLAYCAVLTVIIFASADRVSEVFGPFSVRVSLWPIAWGIVEGMFWIRPFRHREDGARLIAGILGVLLLLLGVFVPIIVADLYAFPISRFEVLFLLYIAVSHVLFAFLGAEIR